MKNSFGTALQATVFGESHGAAVGIVLDGLTPGIPVDEKEIEKQLARRRPAFSWETARQESDSFRILSGVFAGKTTGTPLTVVISNADTKSRDYDYGIARPSHADYSGFAKYHGYEDYRGGGHFSGRVTAALVAAGGILLPALERKQIRIVSHIAKCAGIMDKALPSASRGELARLANAAFPVLDETAAEKMQNEIVAAKQADDSVGGVSETVVYGFPMGMGEPLFDSIEGLLSHGLFAIGGIKGVSFGDGFALSDMRGSEANDSLVMENGTVRTTTNHSGGICGGISNGMPIRFCCAVKPTPSIAKPQDTVDFISRENTSISVKGRHDPAIIARICPVIDAVTALVLSDLLLGRFGSDYFLKEAEK